MKFPTLLSLEDNTFTPYEEIKGIEKYYIDNDLKLVNATIEIHDKRHISHEQRKKWFALIRDASFYTGYPVDYLHQLFKAMYSILEDKQVSMSNTDMTTAKEMIDMLLTWCFDNDVPLAHDTGQLFKGEEQWTYQCFKNRICVVCGKKADRHHTLGSKVGMGNNRNKIDNVGRKFIPLCRIHHSMIESGSEIEFCKKHHIKAIKLNKEQVEEFKL